MAETKITREQLDKMDADYIRGNMIADIRDQVEKRIKQTNASEEVASMARARGDELVAKVEGASIERVLKYRGVSYPTNINALLLIVNEW